MDSDSVFSVEANKCVCSSNIDIFDNGYFWEVRVGDKPIFLIPKEEPGRYLRRYISLPPPNNISREDADKILQCIYRCGSGGESAGDRLTQNVAVALFDRDRTASISTACLGGKSAEGFQGFDQVVISLIDLDAIRSRNISVIATEMAVNFIEFYKAKWFVVRDADIGIYCWDGRRYVECETFIYRYLESCYDTFNMDSYRIRRGALLKEFVIAVKGRARYELSYEPLAISFNNTVLDWEALLNNNIGDVFRGHSPNTIIFHHIPHSIDKDLIYLAVKGFGNGLALERFEELAKRYSPKTYEAFRTWAGDKWILLYEIIGAVLYPKHIKKAFLVYGSPDSGKSTYLRFLEKLIGRENYSSVKLQDLVDPGQRFKTYRVYRKLANIYADLPATALKSLGEFKVLTGGDSIEVERKFRDSFTWDSVYVKFIFSCNKPPKIANIGEADEAFWNRWIVVKFPESIPRDRQVREFEETLLSEASEVLAIAVLALYTIAKRNWVFSYENTAEDAKNEWLTMSDSVYAWLTARKRQGLLIEDATARTESATLFQDYIEWCNEVEDRTGEEIERVDQARFTARLKMYVKAVSKKHTTYFLLNLKAKESLNTPLGE